MVPQIDFLPVTYHVQREREQKTLWRRTTMFLFLALAVLGTIQQRELRRKLETRRDELQARAAGLQQNAVPSEVATQKYLKELETRALLLTTLELRVPTTRVLSALTTSLPEFVSLTDCQADWSPLENLVVANVKVPVPNSASTEKPSPIETDLKELQSASKKMGLFLTIHGFAPDDLEITRYLNQLHQTELFDRITLVVSNQHRVQDEPLRHFEARLQLKSPHALMYAPSVDRRAVKPQEQALTTTTLSSPSNSNTRGVASR